MTTSFPITPHGMAVDSAMSPAKPANPSGPRLLEILAKNFPLHPEDSDQPLSDRYFEQIMRSRWGDVKNDGIDNWVHAHIILPALGINPAEKAQLQPKLARLTEHVGTSNAFFLLVKGYQLTLQSQALAKTADHFAEHNLACTLFAELLQDFILEHRTAYHALDLTRLKFEHTAPEVVLFQQQLEQAARFSYQRLGGIALGIFATLSGFFGLWQLSQRTAIQPAGDALTRVLSNSPPQQDATNSFYGSAASSSRMHDLGFPSNTSQSSINNDCQGIALREREPNTSALIYKDLISLAQTQPTQQPNFNLPRTFSANQHKTPHSRINPYSIAQGTLFGGTLLALYWLFWPSKGNTPDLLVKKENKETSPTILSVVIDDPLNQGESRIEEENSSKKPDITEDDQTLIEEDPVTTNCNILQEFSEDAKNAYQLIWDSLTEHDPSARARLETCAENNQYASYCLDFLQELEKKSPEDAKTAKDVESTKSPEYEFCNWLDERKDNDQEAHELLSLIAFDESPADINLTILLCRHLINVVKDYQDAISKTPEDTLEMESKEWLDALTFKLDSIPDSSIKFYLWALLHQVLDDHKKASEYLQNALVLQHSDNMFENSGQFLQQIGSLYLELAESDEEMNSELTKMGAYCLLRAAWKLEPEAREELQQLSQKEPQHQLLQLYLALLQDHLPTDDSSDQALIEKLQSHCTTHYDAVHTTLELMRDKEHIQETNQALAELLKNTSLTEIAAALE